MKKTLLSALVACAALCSCSTEKETENCLLDNLYGQWNIVEANGLSTTGTESEPFIHFTDSGAVNGNTSVNAFFGQYTVKGDSISFDQMGSTRRMGENMEVEMAVLTALGQCITLDIQDSILNAKDHGGNIIMVMKRN